MPSVHVQNFLITISNRDLADVGRVAHHLLCESLTRQVRRRVDGGSREPARTLSAVNSLRLGRLEQVTRDSLGLVADRELRRRLPEVLDRVRRCYREVDPAKAATINRRGRPNSHRDFSATNPALSTANATSRRN